MHSYVHVSSSHSYKYIHSYLLIATTAVVMVCTKSPESRASLQVTGTPLEMKLSSGTNLSWDINWGRVANTENENSSPPLCTVSRSPSPNTPSPVVSEVIPRLPKTHCSVVAPVMVQVTVALSPEHTVPGPDKVPLAGSTNTKTMGRRNAGHGVYAYFQCPEQTDRLTAPCI